MSSNSTGTATVPVEKEREDSTSPEQTTTGETAYEPPESPHCSGTAPAEGKDDPPGGGGSDRNPPTPI